jgi:hypothetical protein
MKSLASAKTAAAKFIVTIGGLVVGGSVGREGPTVQISATIMAYAHKLFRVPLRASVMVAGGAAGVVQPVCDRAALARILASVDALVHGCEAETFCMTAAEARASCR